MAINRLAPAAAASSISAVAAVPGAAIKQYTITRNFSAGIYVITVSDSTNAFVEFFNSTASVLKATTSSGTVTVSLASDCTAAIVTLLTSASASVQINQTASTLLSTEISGTLDIISTVGTSTYSQTGKLYVVCIGGGGGGAGGGNDVCEGGVGGTISGKLLVASTSTSVTVGAGGNAGSGQSAGSTGGTTSFGALLSSTGGRGGTYGTRTPPNISSVNYWTSIVSGDTTSGGGGANGANGIAHYNNMITTTLGAAGRGGTSTTTGGRGPGYRDGEHATGYGQGGGGSFGTTGALGGNGSQGVIYVLRGF